MSASNKQLRINSPTVDPEDGNYMAQCQFAIEPSLIKMLHIAEQAGWDRSHVVMAALSVCAGYAELTESLPVLQ
ncbi:hypothetical protein [Aminobacter sp. AP02]|uniref:hypothetical protein n=1 Tax=Aminobacter sp. AP02 TaxID=2135737 RepID=UPI000D6DAEC3|nr:hypothetical protein [Aminobacter sp. AP02]PWK72703.1 hypothetical protein C8K44_105145 [Aminobacter sp. AP02]